MAEFKLTSQIVEVTMRHRAYCEDDNWKARYWQSDINEAWDDANKHLNEPGNSDHVVDVITEQKTITRVRYQKR